MLEASEVKPPEYDTEFHREELTSWDQIQSHSVPGWYYRGHEKITHGLTTLLERCCQLENVEKPLRFELALIRAFRRAYHHYDHYVPDFDHKVEWMALMQHHGAPTRLLDFTYSIYVAAFFAFEKAED